MTIRVTCRRCGVTYVWFIGHLCIPPGKPRQGEVNIMLNGGSSQNSGAAGSISTWGHDRTEPLLWQFLCPMPRR